MKTINIAGRELLFDSKFVLHYESYTCVDFEQMAVGFLCAEYEKANIEDAVSGKTNNELIQVIMKWANTDLEGMGVPYASV